MIEVTDFLKDGETVSETIRVKQEGTPVDFSIHILDRPNLTPNDEVFLEIYQSSEPVVLIDGNPLHLEVIHGFGRLAMIDLATGEASNIFLEPGEEVEVSSHNNLYWYDNVGCDDALIIRDHCDDFNPAHEPSLEAVAKVLTFGAHS